MSKWKKARGTLGSPFVVGHRNGKECIIINEGSFYDENNEPELNEIESNVNLIVAAPDMLECLENLVKRNLIKHTDGDHYVEVLEVIRSAKEGDTKNE
jgi:hypothetical protein